jgi:hypothetical protein
MVFVTNYAKTTLHWSPSFSVLQIYDVILLFIIIIIIINGFSSLLPLASWRSTDQCYTAFITEHSTLLPVMMNSSWSSCESLTIISLSWWRKIIIVTYSTLSRQTSSAFPCHDYGDLSNVILSTWRSSHQCYFRQDELSFIPYCHDESLKVFTFSRWQSSHHYYIFMVKVIPTLTCRPVSQNFSW